MTNTIKDFFAKNGANLEYIREESYNALNIYYFNYTNFNNINKLNLIIKSLKAYLNNNNISFSFENGILKLEISILNPNIIYFSNYIKNAPKNQNYIFLGLNTKGLPIYENLNNIKSLLIGGSSGSGKSNLLHNIIISSLLFNKNIYYYMIDLKATELTYYNKILKNSNRLLKPVATNQKQAIKIIIEFYYIIKNRFNKMQKNEQRQSTEAPILLIIDEYAQLFNDNKEKKLINNYIAKIGAIGRACNCYLILATQHPTNENLNNTIRANLQSRICLKCSNSQQSKNIINMVGGEKISRVGDMIIHIDGKQPEFIRATFVSDNFLNELEKTNNKKINGA